ncbi:MAG: efflux RND transporter periplasmic adaptor subunit [Planctomycetia bacterium]|uniref:Efflux transporter periplasmic adaptor subunit n=1 Tax=Candidatus Brocadia sapporoensis TaxID=392547 RepID=A0A1V6M1U1_9BACT|nr:efflux RND transporter periplasmic adaptor subunit [Candidatus Brocadia sapporoensis]MCC7238605.1 efflux RND transporter periplasmic adaptor subunit [Candidatus Brocadia sp.]QOJ07286.1 MAG: efflux RND transporter periplasmic adaptor subunit [Planctomycetia bacterium]TVL96747.1 MAG: efflux RND transporter periplasmic adaptor subunit [Candidatus Brocadia sp. BL1]MDG6006587.1 efflux RND transporter periplasmic adaptor subunit [Candidatus Brocadia sp.]OQD46340.1 efflux transporter periplasmic a
MNYFFIMKYGFILGIAFILASCSSGSGEKHMMPAGVPVTVAVAEQKDIPIQIHTIGNVEAYSTVSVKTRVEGEISRIYFKEGQEVKKGDLLYMIDPRPFKAMLQQFEASLLRDTAQMKKAEADAHRYEELLKSGVVSKQEHDQYHTDYEALKATVSADEAAVQNAKLQLGYCHIRSPINGRIGKLEVNQGNIVKDIDTVLVTINQTKPIYVAFTLPEQEVSEVRKYMAQKNLEVQAIVPGSKVSPVIGELTFINNEVDKSTGTILLKAVYPNEDEFLWPKQFVNVILTLTTQPNAVVIPSQAVQTGQDGLYVYVVKSDLTVEYRPVVVGNRMDQEMVIAKGLRPGEKIVTDGQFQIIHGSKVEIKNDLESLTPNSSDLDNQKSDKREE